MVPTDISDRAEQVAGLLALLSNPHRLRILCTLAEGEAHVGALCAGLPLSQSALSQHLARLREAGVVATRREAQVIHYRIADPDVMRLMSALYDVFCRDQKP